MRDRSIYRDSWDGGGRALRHQQQQDRDLSPHLLGIGMNTVHFGIMMIFNLCIGTITPPVGTTLFVGVKVGENSIKKVVGLLLWYFAVLMLVTYVPVLLGDWDISVKYLNTVYKKISQKMVIESLKVT